MSILYKYLKGKLAAAANGLPVFAWDQWQSTDYYFLPSSNELKRLENISGNANRALTIAVGECLCALLSQSDRCAEALEYFDAAWGSQIDTRNCEFVELDAGEWAGPANGALRAAIMITNDAIFEAPQDFQFSLRGCWALNLLRHVAGLHEPEIWRVWADPVITELMKYHADVTLESHSIFDSTFTFGRPVGPRLFTLDPSYTPAETESDLHSHVSKLSADNRFRGDQP